MFFLICGDGFWVFKMSDLVSNEGVGVGFCCDISERVCFRLLGELVDGCKVVFEIRR